MRKGILGLLAYCLVGLDVAQGQVLPGGGYEEPLPIQPPGARYGVQPYGLSAPGRFPAYMAPNYPSDGPAPGNFTSTVQAGAQEPASALPPPAVFNSRQGLPVQPLHAAETETLARESAQDVPGSDPAGWGALPAEPAEPYLVGPVGTWKPSKGYTFYGTADYLLWWIKKQSLPANISLSLSSPNTPPEITSADHQGGRFLLGMWLSDRQDLSLEAGYFDLFARTNNDMQSFGASAVAMRPIFAGIDKESVLVATSTSFWGAEANLRYELWRTNRADLEQGAPNPNAAVTCHFDVLGGFRYVDLSEALMLNNSTVFSTAPVALSNALLTTSDVFGTHNNLYAGQIGADWGVSWGRLSANMYAKVAMGDNVETVNISGLTQVSGPPVLGTPTAPGGFFAQPSNIGQHNRDVFSVFPEAGLNVGYKLGDHCRLGVGYSFACFTNVVRPGQEIDATAGGATRPPTVFLGTPVPQPTFGFNNATFWAQGVNFTIELSY